MIGISKHHNNYYTDTYYQSGPLSAVDVANNKAMCVHKLIYKNALEMLLNDLNAYPGYIDNNGVSRKLSKEDIHNIIELNENEFWKPSKVFIIYKINTEKGKRFIRKKYDLTRYWFSFIQKYNRKSNHIKITNENINDIEIIKYDYIKGVAILKSKSTDVEFEIDFNDLSGDDIVSDDLRLNDDLFIKQINKI